MTTCATIHLVTKNYFFVSLFQIVETLLLQGGHIDAKNRNGQRPVDLLRAIPDCKINPLQVPEVDSKTSSLSLAP